MSILANIATELVDVLAPMLDGLTGYDAPARNLTLPAFVVGVPDAVAYNVTASGRARYTIPVACVVGVNQDVAPLMDFLSHDTVCAALHGLEAPGVWLGELQVTEGTGIDVVDVAGNPALQVVITIIVRA